MSNALRPLLLILALAMGLPVQAQEPPREGSSEREDAGDRVRQVERDGGRVLQAEPMQRSGREVYRLKVLTPEGRVRVLDDSRRRDSRPERFQERRYREPDPRPEPPEPVDYGRPEPGRGEEGGNRSPNY